MHTIIRISKYMLRGPR